MRVALVSCVDLPDWEVDDLPFHEALRARGVVFSQPAWSDPSVDWSSFDVALLRTTWDYAHQVPAFVAWAERAATQTRLLHSAAVVRWNARKTYLRDMEDKGIAIAPTQWLDEHTDLSALRAQLLAWSSPKGFIKPVMGQTARETLRFTTDEAGVDEAMAHLTRLLPVEPMMLQPYLPAVEQEGELSLLWLGEGWSHGVRKVPVPGDYRVQDDFGAHDEPLPMSEELVAFGDRVMAAARACLGDEALLYARVDVLRMPDGGLVLNELEIIEPSLFFRHGPDAAAQLADGLLSRL